MFARCVVFALLFAAAPAHADRYVVTTRTAALRSRSDDGALTSRLPARGADSYLVFRVLEQRGSLLHVEAADTMTNADGHCVSGDWAVELIKLRAWIRASDAVAVTTRLVDVTVGSVAMRVAPGVATRSLPGAKWPDGAVGTFYTPAPHGSACVARADAKPARSSGPPILGVVSDRPAPTAEFTVPKGAQLLWPDGAPAGVTPANMSLSPAGRAGALRCGIWADLRLCFDDKH